MVQGSGLMQNGGSFSRGNNISTPIDFTQLDTSPVKRKINSNNGQATATIQPSGILIHSHNFFRASLQLTIAYLDWLHAKERLTKHKLFVSAVEVLLHTRAINFELHHFASASPKEAIWKYECCNLSQLKIKVALNKWSSQQTNEPSSQERSD